MNAQTASDPRLAKALDDVVAALDRSDTDQAVRLARAALDKQLVHPIFLNLRAQWLNQRGRTEEALTTLEEARKLDPESIPVLNALGLALTGRSRLMEAMDAFETIIALNPDFAPVYFNHGEACALAGELDKARKSYEEAVARGGSAAETALAQARLAMLAGRRGDWDEARDLAARALELVPGHLIAELVLARSETQTGDFERAEARLRKVLAAPDLTDNDRYHAMGALGDLRHRQQRYAEAFAAYTGGNAEWRHKASTRYGYGRKRALDLVNRLYNYYENAETASVPERRGWSGGSGKTRHVFLVGFIRSGTTLLEQVLASHPDVSTMEEKECLAESRTKFLANEKALDRLQTLAGDEREKYVQLYWRNVKERGFDPEGKIFIDKQPFYTIRLPLIAALFPDAKILFTVRDPRDVLLSCLRQRFFLTNLTYELLTPEDAAGFYSAYMRLADRLRQVLPLDLHQIRHEDLVDDFENEAGKVCDFLGIGWTDAMYDFAERGKVRAISSPSAPQIAKGLNREGMGQWRNYREQLAPILPVLQPWVERYGYRSD